MHRSGDTSRAEINIYRFEKSIYCMHACKGERPTTTWPPLGTHTTKKIFLDMGALPVLHWNISSFASLSHPTLLHGAPVTHWSALKRWQDKDALAAVLPRLHVWTSASQSFMYFRESGELGLRSGTRSGILTSGEPEPSGEMVDTQDISINEDLWLDGAEFLAAAMPEALGGEGQQGGALLHTSFKVEEIESAELRQAVFRELQPLQHFTVATEGRAEGPEERETIVWLQSKGVQSHAHYDPLHNLFSQVVGRKMLWLWPPAEQHRLLLYPSFHSGDRQSQLAAPHERVEPAYTPTLHPGDVLYLPPNWFHQTHVLDALSVSVAQWTSSPVVERLDYFPLPWGVSYPGTALGRAARLITARDFVRHLLLQVHAPSCHPRAIAGHRPCPLASSLTNCLTDEADEWNGLPRQLP